MKIVHFNTYSTAGGAAQAVYQLHSSLIKEGLDSILLVKHKTRSSDFCVEIQSKEVNKSSNIFKKIFQKSLFGFVYNKVTFFLKKDSANELKNISAAFNPDIASFSMDAVKEYLVGTDIICLYWIDGFLSVEMICNIQKITKAPIVWTLMDAEPLTGGCHYPEECNGFKESCGNCPQLKSQKENDFSRNLWNKKESSLKELDITFVAASSWVYNYIKASSLFGENPIEKILLSVNIEVFRKIDKKIARTVLNLPKDKKIIFFGAQSLMDKRKGMKFLVQALANLSNILKDKNIFDSILLLSAGSGAIDWNIDFEVKQMGFINDDRILSLCYQAADVFACPSIDDAGPMMINQSVMCGTLVVAFNNGVAPDLITSKERGFLVEKYDSKGFSLKLYEILFNKKIFNEDDWSQPDECKPSVQAGKYHTLFRTVLRKRRIINSS